MFTHTKYLTASLVVIAGLAMTSSTGAIGNANRTTYLTFSGPFQLPGRSLGAGTYIFELPAPESSLAMVRVSSRDRKVIYLTAFTRVVRRPADVPRDRMVAFGEASNGAPAPLKVWYPQYERDGREFIY